MGDEIRVIIWGLFLYPLQSWNVPSDASPFSCPCAIYALRSCVTFTTPHSGSHIIIRTYCWRMAGLCSVVLDPVYTPTPTPPPVCFAFDARKAAGYPRETLLD